MNFLRDIPVLVLGLGDSGLAMARWCARCGASVTVWDSRLPAPGAAATLAPPPNADVLAREWPAVVQTGGELHAERVAQLLAATQLVLKSPGLAPADPRVAPLLQAARDTGIALLGELDLFVRALADLQQAQAYAPQLLAITGTNGKTTTTAMTALLVARTGRRVALAGNIGPTLLDTLAEALAVQAATPVEAVAEASAEVHPDTEAEPSEHAEPPPPAPPADTLPQVWVLELSSFQLDGVRGFEPAAATVLNITQDHLDWHGNLAAYQAAKARVFGSQAVMVINRDDAAVEAMVPVPPAVKGKARRSAAATAAAVDGGRNVLRFGLGAPRRPGDFGLVVENGMAWLVRALPVDETLRRKPRRALAAVAGADAGDTESPYSGDDELHLQRLMPADALRVRGRHNAANALAALALATAIGCPLAPMLHGLREYQGEPHRVQFVLSLPQGGGEVEAYDDSKGTNVGATVAALDGLGADKAPSRLVVILGGDGKGQDFTPLTAPLARHGRAVATIGRDAAAIEAAIAASAASTLPLQRHDTLEAAVAWCFEQALPGDAVLLSPACASLDMFRNYAHRAEVFVLAVQALAADRGIV